MTQDPASAVPPLPSSSAPADDGEQQVDLGPGLRCTLRSTERVAVALTGSLTGEGVTRLHTALLDLTTAQAEQLASGDVVLDLSAVDAVDVDALRLLVTLDHALEVRGHTVQLRNPTPALRRVIAGAGLSDILPLADT